MTRLKISLLAGLVSAAVTCGGLSFISCHRAQEAEALRKANNRMRIEASRRWQALAQGGQGSDHDKSDGGPNEGRSGESSAKDYRNEGRDTPVATLQTFAWACDRGDTETVAKMIAFEPAGRAKAEAFMATLPASVRQQWPSLEKLAATEITHDVMNYPFPSSAVMAKATVVELGNGCVRLRLPDTNRDNTKYVKTAEGWAYVVPEKEIDAYIREQTSPR